MNECTLCEYGLSQTPVIDGDKVFCCFGCHAVYNILATSNQLSNYQDTSVFKQAVRSGLISNPMLLEQIRNKPKDVPADELKRDFFEVSGMWCPACAEVIRYILLKEKGVYQCVVDYATDCVSIEYSPRHISREKISSLIQSIGYTIIDQDAQKRAVSRDLYLRLAVATFFSLNIMMFTSPLYAAYFNFEADGSVGFFTWLSFFMVIPVVTYSAWPIFRRFLTGLQIGFYGMETLVVIGVTTALILSVYELFCGDTHIYFDSLAVIITFMLLGKVIESKAKFSVKESLFQLEKTLPKRGRKRFLDGSETFVALKDIYLKDIILVYPGEKIVLDGVVIKGKGHCDESIMTGEPRLVEKETGSQVIAGSILNQGFLEIRVTKTEEDSSLRKIVDLIKQEMGYKSSYVRAADHIVHRFVPVVLVTACLTALLCYGFHVHDPGKSQLETALLRALSVLLISCPCALGIAAPLAESYVITGAAKWGALIRNRACLAYLGKESVCVFDKTGTVTYGNFTVLSGLDGISLELLSILKGLVKRSIHPISLAINAAIEGQETYLENVEELSGKGLKGLHKNRPVILGSAAFFNELGITFSGHSIHSNEVQTRVYFAYDGNHIATLILGDTIRSEIHQTLKELSSVKTLLLSGDGFSAVSTVANRCGFTDWQAQCSPHHKRKVIEQLRKQGETVCMIGDGINDAPALTAAHVGISVLSATDISIHVSDILLTSDNLTVIPKIQSLSKKGHRIIKQNLFWAFFYNILGIGLAMLGLLSPIFAAFAMITSSTIVLFNARRLISV